MGHTYPGATVPFGMVQLSPDTDTLLYSYGQGYNPAVYRYCAGYQYDDPTIVGFSHTHFHGTGHADLGDLLELTALAERALRAEYRPHGMNFGANVGRVAGAGFPGHLHLHVVPRWDGDTNFMAAVGETRVVPEALDRTWARLRRAIRRLEGVPDGGRRRRGPSA